MLADSLRFQIPTNAKPENVRGNFKRQTLRRFITILTIYFPTVLFGQIKDSIKLDSLFLTHLELTTSKLGELNLTEVLKFEKKANSKDITPDHFIELGGGIYPNNKHYKLKTPKTFSRIADSIITIQTEYYYSKKSIIRVILYEWNETPSPQNDFSFENNLDSTKINAFQEMFNMIKISVSNHLGKPIQENIESVNEKTFRDDVKWESATGVNAYLFMFGNNSGYRQIRLAVYKE
jgi:hypothetical protein